MTKRDPWEFVEFDTEKNVFIISDEEFTDIKEAHEFLGFLNGIHRFIEKRDKQVDKNW